MFILLFSGEFFYANPASELSPEPSFQKPLLLHNITHLRSKRTISQELGIPGPLRGLEVVPNAWLLRCSDKEDRMLLSCGSQHRHEWGRTRWKRTLEARAGNELNCNRRYVLHEYSTHPCSLIMFRFSPYQDLLSSSSNLNRTFQPFSAWPLSPAFLRGPITR